MAGVDRRNNRKRLECLKKKSKELSVLCDVEVLFLCKEPSSVSSLDCWPEDSNACLSLIDKYRKTANKNPSSNSDCSSVLGKRKRRSDDQAISGSNGHASKRFHMGFEGGERCQMGFEDGGERFQMGFCKNLSESESSETGSLRNIFQNIDGIVDVLGYPELQKMMSLVDAATKLADEKLFSLLGGIGKEPVSDSGVDWDELMTILQNDECDFDF